MKTQVEIDAARSTVRACKSLVRHLDEVNWEQRRYEVAKDAFCTLINDITFPTSIENKEMWAREAIAYADCFIKVLKKGGERNEE